MDHKLLISLGIALVLGFAAAAPAANLDVDSTQDSPDAKPGDGKCVSKAGGCTLRAAVEEANATTLADTINLPPGTYTLESQDRGANFAQTGVLFLNGEIEILGGDPKSTVVDGGGKGRVFEIEADASISISGLTVAGGSVTSDGAGIMNRGHLKLMNVVLKGNRAKVDPLNANGRGAGLFNGDHGDARLIDVTVSDNTADGRGGGIYNAAAMQLMNGTVSGNASLTDDGGGIQNDGTLSLLLTEVDGNRAKNGAGINNLEGNLKLEGSTLAGNSASSDGGAIYNSGTVTTTNSTLSGNSAGTRGGAIANRANGQVALDNVTVTGNKAGSGSEAKGGGIANGPAGTVKVANSILAANAAASGPDCSGTLASQGYNLVQSAAGCSITGDLAGNVVGQEAKLAVLAKNDGPTRTHALLPGSPAIDAGNPAKPTGRDGTCAPADQRGVARPAAGAAGAPARCDVGAFEVGKPR